MKKVKVVEIIPHIDLETGKRGETEVIEEVKEITKPEIFGKNVFKIKIKPSLFGDCIKVYGEGASVVKVSEDGGIDLMKREKPIKVKKGQKVSLAFQAFDYTGSFGVEYLEK